MAIVRGGELRGLAFPIMKGREGYWPRRNAKALRRSSIMMILGTYPGERVGEPEFGSLLYRLTFEPNDTILIQQIREETAGAIRRWDPLVRVLGVTVEQNSNTLTIFIDYMDLSDTNQDARRVVFNVRRS